MTMTLEKVRDALRKSNAIYFDTGDINELITPSEMADAIDAHMAAVREVIAEVEEIIEVESVGAAVQIRLIRASDKLEAAINTTGAIGENGK